MRVVVVAGADERADESQFVGHPSQPGEQLADVDPTIAPHLEIEAKYDVYVTRQVADIEALRRDEHLKLGETIDYTAVNGLSNEARQRLEATRPSTVGQASRMDGMTPAALTLLVAHLRRKPRGSPRQTAG